MQHFLSLCLRKFEKLAVQKWFPFLLIAIVIVTTTVQVTAIRRVGISRPAGYTSDDVAQQTILSQWQRGYHVGAGLGDDNWFLKFPLYWTVNQVPADPDTRAFVTSWLLTILTVAGAVLVTDRIVKWSFGSRPITLAARILPAAAIAALAHLTLYNVALMNTRNIEIPIFLFLLYALIAHADGPILLKKQHYKWLSIIVILLALLLADDPIFFYMGVVPVGLVVGMRALREKARLRPAMDIIAILLAGYVGRWVVMKVLLRLTTIIVLVHPAQFASAAGFFTNIQALASSGLEIFGANIWGQTRNMMAAITALNIFLLVMGLVAAGLLLRRARTDSKTGMGVQALGLLPFWMIGLVAVANFSAEPRYLMIVPFVLPVCIGVAAGLKLLSGRLVAVIVAVCVVCAGYNVAYAAATILKHPQNNANIEEKAVVKVLAEHDLTKGFGTYWVANAVTYASDFKTDVVGITCDDGVAYDFILSERAVLQKPAQHTYVLSYEPGSGVHSVCPLETIKKQFGDPDELLNIPTDSKGVIAVYHRDITPDVTGKP